MFCPDFKNQGYTGGDAPGDTVTYDYDDYGRVVGETYKDESGNVTASFGYLYNSEGNLARKVDNLTGDTVNYTYDSLGRLIHSYLTEDSAVTVMTEHQYDRAGRLSQQAWQFADRSYTENYLYNAEDSTLAIVKSTDYAEYAFSYDGLNRVASQYNYYFKQLYSYHDADGIASTQVSGLEFNKPGDGDQFDDFALSYEYDALGNISSITDSRGDTRSYTYDIQGQLLTETINGVVHTYTYDTYGNIRTADGVEYRYENTNWLDLLTAYDGETITYDAVGNPLSYYNGTRWTFDWQNGRQLASATDGTTSISYTYGVDGIRNSKTVDGVTYNYITLNGKVVRQTWTENGVDYVFDIIYDVNGRPYACFYQGIIYYYVCNLQGDVIRIINGNSSQTLVEYTYDAWGNTLSTTGSMKDTLGEVNPIRYRGYYYDTETGFYYLQSRYYDPGIGRYLNIDTVFDYDTGFPGYNLYAYCGNSPIFRIDASGNDSEGLEDGIDDVYEANDLDGGKGSNRNSTGSNNNSNGGSGGKGYSSYGAFKRANGSAGEGKQWHHVVEQSQVKRSGFSPESVQNTSNIYAVESGTHVLISGYYSSVVPAVSGSVTIRDWLTGQSFSDQFSFGIGVMKMFGVLE